METFEANHKQGLALPEDLREWVNRAQLLHLVFDAAHAVENDRSQAGEALLPPGAPRTVLSLLIYSYAIGLYSSEEIERRIPTDDELLYLSARTNPSSSTLRHFRRFNHPVLRSCLGKLLEMAQSLRPPLPDRDEDGLSSERTGSAAWQKLAEERILRAILADTMALDI